MTSNFDLTLRHCLRDVIKTGFVAERPIYIFIYFFSYKRTSVGPPSVSSGVNSPGQIQFNLKQIAKEMKLFLSRRHLICMTHTKNRHKNPVRLTS